MGRYIDKDALIEKIKKRLHKYEKEYERLAHYEIWITAKEIEPKIKELKNLLSFIDTIEVKDVDLDFQRFAKEMEIVFALPSSKIKNTEEDQLNWEYVIAKHFFELGLKAQKGE